MSAPRLPSQTSNRSQTSNTSSAAAASVRPPLKIHSTAIVSERAVLTGSHPITIGERAVIHPFAHLRAEGGSVTIGEYCTIDETAVVGLPAGEGGEVVLEKGVAVHSGAVVLGSIIGEGSEIGVKARIGKGATVGQYATVAAAETVEDGGKVGDFGVVFGGGRKRVDGLLEGSEELRELRLTSQRKMCKALESLVPDGGMKRRGPPLVQVQLELAPHAHMNAIKGPTL
nr:hypothetical protein B0A51_13356 [Rachicladosporium sp. CCFEE 5018]